MNEQKIPAGHQVLMPYLILPNASGFMEFTKKVFGAEETFNRRRDEKHIMHAEVKIGGSTIMFCDSVADWKPQPSGFFVYVDNADETYKKAIAEGAVSLMEVENKDYGRSGGVTDPFGNVWWITSVTEK